jgi:hypothetical protein
MAVRLSASSAGRPSPPERFLRLSRPQDHSAAGRIRSIEKSNDLMGNRTRGLPACSIVPHPTTLQIYNIWAFEGSRDSYFHLVDRDVWSCRYDEYTNVWGEHTALHSKGRLASTMKTEAIFLSKTLIPTYIITISINYIIYRSMHLDGLQHKKCHVRHR